MFTVAVVVVVAVIVGCCLLLVAGVGGGVAVAVAVLLFLFQLPVFLPSRLLALSIAFLRAFLHSLLLSATTLA